MAQTRYPQATHLSIAQRAESYQRATDIALQPADPNAKRRSGFLGLALFAKTDVVKATEAVYRRDVSWRPLLTPSSYGEAAPDQAGSEPQVQFVSRNLAKRLRSRR